jgi:two-component system, NtrC family, response regulator AtoC
MSTPADGKDTILIVDDNRRLCESLAANFADAGMAAVAAHDHAAAVRLFGGQKVSAVLLDLMVGEESGLDILAELRARDVRVPVIMITGFATVDTAVQALKLGAADYVKKPLRFEDLLKVVQGALRLSQLSEENRILRQRLQDRAPRVTAAGAPMKDLMERVRKLAATDLPILITGENGTGKELVADALHEWSRRSARKLLKVNCAAIPESLLESELFGHEKGSFTGADSQHRGVFEQAGGGTLFLDEIGDMPLPTQSKILRALQNREIRRLGGAEILTVDVRFLAATNHPIDELIRDGKFREDLYYRLCGAVLNVPPLRERREDIPELVRVFVEEYCALNALPGKAVTPLLMDRFLACPWPGNVRELRNTVNYACAISGGRQVGVEDLPPAFGRPVDGGGGALNVREEAEKALIVRMLQQSNFNKVLAAQRLSMSRKTLYNKIVRYGITGSPGRS